jgi:hypothetical protein
VGRILGEGEYSPIFIVIIDKERVVCSDCSRARRICKAIMGGALSADHCPSLDPIMSGNGIRSGLEMGVTFAGCHWFLQYLSFIPYVSQASCVGRSVRH